MPLFEKIRLNHYRVKKALRSPVKNVFSSKFSRRALISYINHPLFGLSSKHINSSEVVWMAEVINELGYIVDVCDDKYPPLDYKKYHLIIGTGLNFDHYLSKGGLGATRIFYSPGMHEDFQNQKTLRQLQRFKDRRGAVLKESVRYVSDTRSPVFKSADSLIVMGNKKCQQSFAPSFSETICTVPAPYLCSGEIASNFNRKSSQTKNSFLWIGGAGKIHKGLDLCIEVIGDMPHAQLHICGSFKGEERFVEHYKKELSLSNIHLYGSLDYNSDEFNRVLKKTSAVLSPTASEGGAPAVVSAIGNGALFPIISSNTCLDIPECVYIQELTIDGVKNSH